MSDEAAATLDTAEFRDTETARKYFDAGYEAEQNGDRIAAIESYEAAYTADPEDTENCFRLAYNLDLLGEEDEAAYARWRSQLVRPKIKSDAER